MRPGGGRRSEDAELTGIFIAAGEERCAGVGDFDLAEQVGLALAFDEP